MTPSVRTANFVAMIIGAVIWRICYEIEAWSNEPSDASSPKDAQP